MDKKQQEQKKLIQSLQEREEQTCLFVATICPFSVSIDSMILGPLCSLILLRPNTHQKYHLALNVILNSRLATIITRDSSAIISLLEVSHSIVILATNPLFLESTIAKEKHLSVASGQDSRSQTQA